MLRVESGDITQVVHFVAVDSTDLKTRETGLTTFTVYRARGTGAATAMTTPTVSELSAANMPGVYSLLMDEDMTITAGKLSEVMTYHITQASMAPVTLSVEVFRPLGVGAVKTAQGAAAGSLTLAAGEVGTNDFKLGDLLIIEDNGTAAATGQQRMITDSVASTDVATLDRAWDTTPTGTIKYRRIAGSLPQTTTELSAETATAVLAKDMGNSRTVKQALGTIRNKVVIDRSGNTITVYDTDDTAVLWSGTIATATGNPLSSVDPS